MLYIIYKRSTDPYIEFDDLEKTNFNYLFYGDQSGGFVLLIISEKYSGTTIIKRSDLE